MNEKKSRRQESRRESGYFTISMKWKGTIHQKVIFTDDRQVRKLERKIERICEGGR